MSGRGEKDSGARDGAGDEVGSHTETVGADHSVTVGYTGEDSQRKIMLERIRRMDQESATIVAKKLFDVILCQAIARAWLARGLVKLKKKVLRKAAVNLQRIWRGHISRKITAQMQKTVAQAVEEVVIPQMDEKELDDWVNNLLGIKVDVATPLTSPRANKLGNWSFGRKPSGVSPARFTHDGKIEDEEVVEEGWGGKEYKSVTKELLEHNMKARIGRKCSPLRSQHSKWGGTKSRQKRQVAVELKKVKAAQGEAESLKSSSILSSVFSRRQGKRQQELEKRTKIAQAKKAGKPAEPAAVGLASEDLIRAKCNLVIERDRRGVHQQPATFLWDFVRGLGLETMRGKITHLAGSLINTHETHITIDLRGKGIRKAAERVMGLLGRQIGKYCISEIKSVDVFQLSPEEALEQDKPGPEAYGKACVRPLKTVLNALETFATTSWMSELTHLRQIASTLDGKAKRKLILFLRSLPSNLGKRYTGLCLPDAVVSRQKVSREQATITNLMLSGYHSQKFQHQLQVEWHLEVQNHFSFDSKDLLHVIQERLDLGPVQLRVRSTRDGLLKVHDKYVMMEINGYIDDVELAEVKLWAVENEYVGTYYVKSIQVMADITEKKLAGNWKKLRRGSTLGIESPNYVPEPVSTPSPKKTLFGSLTINTDGVGQEAAEEKESSSVAESVCEEEETPLIERESKTRMGAGTKEKKASSNKMASKRKGVVRGSGVGTSYRDAREAQKKKKAEEDAIAAKEKEARMAKRADERRLMQEERNQASIERMGILAALQDGTLSVVKESLDQSRILSRLQNVLMKDVFPTRMELLLGHNRNLCDIQSEVMKKIMHKRKPSPTEMVDSSVVIQGALRGKAARKQVDVMTEAEAKLREEMKEKTRNAVTQRVANKTNQAKLDVEIRLSVAQEIVMNTKRKIRRKKQAYCEAQSGRHKWLVMGFCGDRAQSAALHDAGFVPDLLIFIEEGGEGAFIDGRRKKIRKEELQEHFGERMRTLKLPGKLCENVAMEALFASDWSRMLQRERLVVAVVDEGGRGQLVGGSREALVATIVNKFCIKMADAFSMRFVCMANLVKEELDENTPLSFALKEKLNRGQAQEIEEQLYVTMLCRHMGISPPEGSMALVSTDSVLDTWNEATFVELTNTQKGLLSVMLRRLLTAFGKENEALWELNEQIALFEEPVASPGNKATPDAYAKDLDAMLFQLQHTQSIAEKSILELRQQIGNVVNPLQQAKVLVYVATFNPPGDRMWSIISLGLCPSLDLNWLPNPWLPNRAGRGRQMHKWWLNKIFNECGLNPKTRDAIEDRITRLRDHIVNNERKATQLIDELRRAMFSLLTSGYRDMCTQALEADRHEAKSIREMLTVEQRCLALSQDLGRQDSQGARETSMPLIITLESSKEIAEKVMESWGLDDLTEEQEEKLVAAYHRLRETGEILRRRLRHQMISIAQELISDDSGEGGGLINDTECLHTLDGMWDKGWHDLMFLRKQLRQCLTPYQRARVSLVGYTPAGQGEEGFGNIEATLEEVSTLHLPHQMDFILPSIWKSQDEATTTTEMKAPDSPGVVTGGDIASRRLQRMAQLEARYDEPVSPSPMKKVQKRVSNLTELYQVLQLSSEQSQTLNEIFNKAKEDDELIDQRHVGLCKDLYTAINTYQEALGRKEGGEKQKENKERLRAEGKEDEESEMSYAESASEANAGKSDAFMSELRLLELDRRVEALYEQWGSAYQQEEGMVAEELLPSQRSAAVAMTVGERQVVERLDCLQDSGRQARVYAEEQEHCYVMSLKLVHTWEEYGKGAIRVTDQQVKNIAQQIYALKQARRSGNVRMKASSLSCIELYETGAEKEVIHAAMNVLDEAVESTSEAIITARKKIHDELDSTQLAVSFCVRGEDEQTDGSDVRAWHGVTLGLVEEITIERLAPHSHCGLWLGPTGCVNLPMTQEGDVHYEIRELLSFVDLNSETTRIIMRRLLRHEDTVQSRVRHICTQMEELRLATQSEIQASAPSL